MEHTTLTFDTISRHCTEFYREIYFVQTLQKHELINLHAFSTDRPILLVDSCGWYYQQLFPEYHVHRIEGLNTCKNMRIDRARVDTVFDDRDDWPSFPKIYFANAVLILDHSVLLRYRTPEEVRRILAMLAAATASTEICVRIGLLHSNDSRFQDRLGQLIKILPDGFTVTKFSLDLDARHQPLLAHFRKNVCYDQCVN